MVPASVLRETASLCLPESLFDARPRFSLSITMVLAAPPPGVGMACSTGILYVVLSFVASIGTCVLFQFGAMNGDLHDVGAGGASGGSGYGPAALPLQMAITAPSCSSKLQNAGPPTYLGKWI